MTPAECIAKWKDNKLSARGGARTAHCETKCRLPASACNATERTRDVSRWQRFSCLFAAAFAATFAHAENADKTFAGESIASTTVPQKVDEIKVYGTTEPEDRKGADKSDLQKMRETLEKTGGSRVTTVKESVAPDGTRKARIDVGGNRFCVEQKIGQIDFSGMGKGGMAMKPMPGKDCF